MSEDSQISQDWDDESLNEHIRAVATVLAEQRGGQLDPGDIKEAEEGESAGLTGYTNSLSNNGDDQSWLKESFCDRFAEFASKKVTPVISRVQLSMKIGIVSESSLQESRGFHKTIKNRCCCSQRRGASVPSLLKVLKNDNSEKTTDAHW